MQTKRQIQQLLASASVRPNKRLGQHFLIDLNLMRLLLNSANINTNDIVLEVGCGTGSLTSELIERAGFVIAVELDSTLAQIAESCLENKGNVEFINTDILKNKHTISNIVTDKLQSAQKKCKGRILLVANLPYNVASPVMMNMVTGPLVADAMYVTVQKEVAERMTALPGSGHYGTLSIFLNAVGDVKILRILKPTVFWPKPEVDSAMVAFVRNREKFSRIESMEVLSDTVNLFMGHRRKTLIACSRLAVGKLVKINDNESLCWPEIFEQCGIDSSQRPEQLSSENYIVVANQCCRALEMD